MKKLNYIFHSIYVIFALMKEKSYNKRNTGIKIYA